MIQETAVELLPIWILLSVGLGLLVGKAFGDSIRRQKCLEQTNESLRQDLEKALNGELPLQRELRHQRGVIHDIHKQVSAVTKALAKRPS